MRYAEFTVMFSLQEGDTFESIIDQLQDAIEGVLSPNCTGDIDICAEDCRLEIASGHLLPENYDDISDDEWNDLEEKRAAFLKLEHFKLIHHKRYM